MKILSLTEVQVFLPMMKTGFNQITAGLLSDTFLEAHVSIFFILHHIV